MVHSQSHNRDPVGVSEFRVDRIFSTRHSKWLNDPAISIGDKIVTYKELEAYSNQLSRRLRSLGLGQGDIVAIVCDNVFQFALGALATLKSGAAYFSIDARYPLPQTSEVLHEGVAKLVIGSDRLTSIFPDLKPPIVSDAFNLADLSEFSETAVELRGRAGDAAYICYTSGTSGRPKGVMISHAGIEGLVSHPEFDLFFPRSRVANCMTFSFDAIAHEVWGSLLNGSCLVDIPVSVLQSPTDFATFLKASRIDGALITTSLFNAVVSRHPNAFSSMRCVVIGGEAADPNYVGRVFTAGGAPGRLVNGYGPTETTALATCHTILPEDVERGLIPIGRPFEGRRVYIMNSPTTQAAVGEKGELWIGGAAVGLGYVGDTVLTAEKFVSNPFTKNPGDRLYRTGDLCRMSSEGTVHFLGRIDEQIKVRGYRVEPAGIAAILTSIPGVDEAVVLARESRFGTKELLAFVRGDRAMSPIALRAHAARRMPHYMLPGTFSWIDAIPLKSNGKVDSAALLNYRSADTDEPDGVGASSTDLEKVLMSIWRRHFRDKMFSATTEYRELGGDSLSIISLMMDVENEFGVRLSFADLEPPLTVRTMADVVLARTSSSSTDRPDAASRAFLISYPWSMFRYPEAIGAAMGRGTPPKQIQISPVPGSSAAYDSIESMALILLKQILAEAPKGPYILAGHSLAGVLAFEVACQLEARGETVELLILIDSYISRSRSLADRALTLLKQVGRLLRKNPKRLLTRVKDGKSKIESRTAQKIFDKCGAAMDQYTPRQYAGDALLFYCETYEDFLHMPNYNSRKITYPWPDLIKGKIQSHSVQFDHHSIVNAPNAYLSVAEHIAGCLNGRD